MSLITLGVFFCCLVKTERNGTGKRGWGRNKWVGNMLQCSSAVPIIVARSRAERGTGKE